MSSQHRHQRRGKQLARGAFSQVITPPRNVQTSKVIFSPSTSPAATMNDRECLIKDLKPGMKNLNLHVIALEIGGKYHTKDNHDIRTVKVADKSGSINACVWDEPGAIIQPGDICRISRCYVSMYKGQMTLYIGRGGKIIKIGEFCFIFSELPNMSEEAPSSGPIGPGGPHNNQMVQQNNS